MIRHIDVAHGLLALGVTLLVAPAVVPIQPVLHHDTRPGTVQPRSELAAEDVKVVAYENLSERGQELYVRTLRSGGHYHVPLGEGAPDFEYPSPDDFGDERRFGPGSDTGRTVIERPPDADLPPPDEPTEEADEPREPPRARGERAGRPPTDAGGETPPGEDDQTSGPTIEDRRRLIARYDVMVTQTSPPSLTSRATLLRVLSTVGGVLALGIGGYLRSKP